MLSKFKKAAITVITTATIIFLIKTLFQNYQQTQLTLSSVSLIKLATSFVFFISYLYMRALSWRSIAQSLSSSVDKKNSFIIWFFSEATRYIPGNIWSFVSRAYLAQKHLSLKSAIIVSPIEILIIIMATFLLSSYAIINTIQRFPLNYNLFLLTLVAIIALAAPAIFRKKIIVVLQKISAQSLKVNHLLAASIFQLISWVLYGLGTVVLISNFSMDNLPLLFSSSLLAWLVGYLSIITPMGLGVRESAFVFFTGQYIGVTQAVFIAVLHRLILTLAELVNLAFWVTVKKILKRSFN